MRKELLVFLLIILSGCASNYQYKLYIPINTYGEQFNQVLANKYFKPNSEMFSVFENEKLIINYTMHLPHHLYKIKNKVTPYVQPLCENILNGKEPRPGNLFSVYKNLQEIDVDVLVKYDKDVVSDLYTQVHILCIKRFTK